MRIKSIKLKNNKTGKTLILKRKEEQKDIKLKQPTNFTNKYTA